MIEKCDVPSMATAENATAVDATTNAAAIKTTANPPATDCQTLMSFRGDAPFVYLRPGMSCRRESAAADELTVRGT